MSFVKIYIHAVWTTKDRLPLLNDDIRAKVISHIRNYAQSKNIFIDHINGVKDHLHSLISMSSDQNIATIMNLLKGESSHWINKTKKRAEALTEINLLNPDLKVGANDISEK